MKRDQEMRVRINYIAHGQLKELSDKRKAEGAPVNKQCDILAELIIKAHKKEVLQ